MPSVFIVWSVTGESMGIDPVYLQYLQAILSSYPDPVMIAGGENTEQRQTT